MRLKENLKDFVAIVREYKKFFVPKYCSAPVFYLVLIIMLILPRKLFTLPSKNSTKPDEKFSKNPMDSLSEKDKEMLKEIFNDCYKDDMKRAVSDKRV